MNRSLLLAAVVCTLIYAAAAVKEWKNFENGKVYSHKMPVEKEVDIHEAPPEPRVEERILHSHHRDKKLKNAALQAADEKHLRGKNPERHHKKSIEEEMHLRPLNERHHKFPNPALLDKIDYSDPPSPQISRQKLIKQAKHGESNNRRRQRGRRQKRNKSGHKALMMLNNNSEIDVVDKKLNTKANPTSKVPEKLDLKAPITNKPRLVNEGLPLKMPSYW